MRRDEKQIQGGPEERTGNGEESRSPRPPAGIVISCGVRLSGQAALTNPVNGIPHGRHQVKIRTPLALASVILRVRSRTRFPLSPSCLDALQGRILRVQTCRFLLSFRETTERHLGHSLTSWGD